MAFGMPDIDKLCAPFVDKLDAVVDRLDQVVAKLDEISAKLDASQQ